MTPLVPIFFIATHIKGTKSLHQEQFPSHQLQQKGYFDGPFILQKIKFQNFQTKKITFCPTNRR